MQSTIRYHVPAGANANAKRGRAGNFCQDLHTADSLFRVIASSDVKVTMKQRSKSNHRYDSDSNSGSAT